MRARSVLLSAGMVASLVVGGPPAAADQHAGGWLRTACPPDGTPASSYRDVEGNAHRLGIDCLSWYGVAAGVGDGAYGPERPVRRDQMASFLVNALRAVRVELPPGQNRFSDLQGNVHRDAVERLAEADVVSGAGASLYNPASPVTRAQLASLLLKTHDYFAGAAESERRHDYFADDDDSVHEASINTATERGLLTGLVAGTLDAATGQYRGDGRYDPAGQVRRDQMSSFVARVLGRGTREAPGGHLRPYPRGTVVPLLDGWDAAVVAADDDAADEVERENADNPPAADGHRFVVVRLRGTYRGSGTSTFDGADRFTSLADTGQVLSASGRPCGDIPDELPNPSVARGETVEGNLCLEVPQDHALNPYDERWGKPTAPHFGLVSQSGEPASPYNGPGNGLPDAPPTSAPATLTWFDEPPRFGGDARDGGALAIHRSESSGMTSSVSDEELRVGAFLARDEGLGSFQSVGLRALGTRRVEPGRFVIGQDVALSLDNGTTCHVPSGEVVIHELVVTGGLLTSAAVSIDASYAGAPSFSVCQGRVQAEVRWNSTRPVHAPEHLGTTDAGRVPTGTASAPQRWTIRNDGSVALDLGPARTAGQHAGDVSVLADGCSDRRLMPQETCTVDVATTPGGPGRRRALLEIPDRSVRGARALLVLSEGV